MNFERVMQLIGRWGGTLKFFPSDPDARLGIAEEIAAMASDESQVQWLVQRVPKLYREWPAMREVRAVFCSKFKPRDGFEPYSEAYPDGIPSEREDQKALPAEIPKQLAAGESMSIQPSLNATLADLARSKDLNRALARGSKNEPVRDIPVQRVTDANRITREQIEAEVQKLRERKARAEAGL